MKQKFKTSLANKIFMNMSDKLQGLNYSKKGKGKEKKFRL